jgi:hypothetical protein
MRALRPSTQPLEGDADPLVAMYEVELAQTSRRLFEKRADLVLVLRYLAL